MSKCHTNQSAKGAISFSRKAGGGLRQAYTSSQPPSSICPNCGSQLDGEASDATHTDTVDSVSDPPGDSISGSGGHLGSGGGGASDHVEGVHGLDRTTQPQELAGQPGAERWVADDVQPREPTLEVDASVPGSEVPVDHGGGWTQQDEDGEAPPELTHGMELDRPATDLPQEPDPDLSLDDSGRMLQRRPTPWTGILAVVLLVVIIALGAWYIWGGGGGGDDDDGPDGNGDDPYEGVHLLRDGTWGFYPYEPPASTT